MGPPRLEELCLIVLSDYRAYLSDIGDIPIDLITPVLLQCNAQQLQQIEDATRCLMCIAMPLLRLACGSLVT